MRNNYMTIFAHFNKIFLLIRQKIKSTIQVHHDSQNTFIKAEFFVTVFTKSNLFLHFIVK